MTGWRITKINKIRFRPASERELADDPNKPLRKMKDTYVLHFAHGEVEGWKITCQNKKGIGWVCNLHEPDKIELAQVRSRRMGYVTQPTFDRRERVVKESSGTKPLAFFLKYTLPERVGVFSEELTRVICDTLPS